MRRTSRDVDLPNVAGGANWQGAAFDPETGLLYVSSNTIISALGLVPSGRPEIAYVSGTASNPSGQSSAAAGGNRGRVRTADGGDTADSLAMTIEGLPLVKPPYGRITAIDLKTGDMAWQIAHGDPPDNIKNHPALKGLTIPRTGRPHRAGILVIRTLAIAGEGGFVTTLSGQRRAMLGAYNKAKGQEAGSVYLPAPASGAPMTYMHGGKQYLLLAISGAGYSGELVAFRLAGYPQLRCS